MAGEVFPWAIGMAIGTVLLGRLFDNSAVRVAAVIVIAGPFGVAAVALYAVKRRIEAAGVVGAILTTSAWLFAVAMPFLAGLTAWG